ncbi:unnamed protein product (macronuclear) [Paramecium tetraurelia]|uniref:Uncharacterized protein n=1 Tax=Paramecium tetraurelia TaxID=5888 RepID=A0CY43_PARTE|nr:uncharacterized protein GSPATT00011342001 [Paramecium tetraurelia]CAK75710.1 unnamed protein product [Paramecium tetraurelia]|eukprot:XP_001443107.1 hypothetical protein (macronuclear) [Paramecium tetraurelia strain d4-2]
MKKRESISEPPLDKLEQIRQKFSKQLIKVKSKGFVTCSIGKSIQNDAGSRISYGKSSFLEKLQSINSFEDDEKTLLKSIQFDVQLAIKRYQQRIEQIGQLQVERSSLRSCQQDIMQYFTTPQQEKTDAHLDSLLSSKRSTCKSTQQNTIINPNSNKLMPFNKNVFGNKNSNKTFKIISEKQNKVKQNKKSSNQSLTEISMHKKKQSKDGTLSQKSVSTRQPSVKEIAINLEQRRSTGMILRNQSRQSRNSINSFDNKQPAKKLQVF